MKIILVLILTSLTLSTQAFAENKCVFFFTDDVSPQKILATGAHDVKVKNLRDDGVEFSSSDTVFDLLEMAVNKIFDKNAKTYIPKKTQMKRQSGRVASAVRPYVYDTETLDYRVVQPKDVEQAVQRDIEEYKFWRSFHGLWISKLGFRTWWNSIKTKRLVLLHKKSTSHNVISNHEVEVVNSKDWKYALSFADKVDKKTYDEMVEKYDDLKGERKELPGKVIVIDDYEISPGLKELEKLEESESLLVNITNGTNIGISKAMSARDRKKLVEDILEEEISINQDNIDITKEELNGLEYREAMIKYKSLKKTVENHGKKVEKILRILRIEVERERILNLAINRVPILYGEAVEVFWNKNGKKGITVELPNLNKKGEVVIEGKNFETFSDLVNVRNQAIENIYLIKGEMWLQPIVELFKKRNIMALFGLVSGKTVKDLVHPYQVFTKRTPGAITRLEAKYNKALYQLDKLYRRALSDQDAAFKEVIEQAGLNDKDLKKEVSDEMKELDSEQEVQFKELEALIDKTKSKDEWPVTPESAYYMSKTIYDVENKLTSKRFKFANFEKNISTMLSPFFSKAEIVNLKDVAKDRAERFIYKTPLLVKVAKVHRERIAAGILLFLSSGSIHTELEQVFPTYKEAWTGVVQMAESSKKATYDFTSAILEGKTFSEDDIRNFSNSEILRIYGEGRSVVEKQKLSIELEKVN